jgi:hypothetical protein
MAYEEETVDFSNDPLEGQRIWSSPGLGQWDITRDTDRLCHPGSKPLEEATLEILSVLVGKQGVRISG